MAPMARPPARAFAFAAFSTTRCPRCTPSKVPISDHLQVLGCLVQPWTTSIPPRSFPWHARRHHERRLAFEHALVANLADAMENCASLLRDQVRYPHAGDHFIADMHLCPENERLRDVDTSRPRKLRPQSSRDIRGSEDSMRDPLLERRFGGVGFIEVNGIDVAEMRAKSSISWAVTV